jgi:predicted DNA-binding protein (MmcQ/YjbR family)
MNKTHGNTVYLDGNLEDTVINKMIDDSYNWVYKLVRRKIKPELEERVETCSLILYYV